MILIVAARGDEHVGVVEAELSRRGVASLQLDLADLPTRAQLSMA